jgi:triacylglycerol lipase
MGRSANLKPFSCCCCRQFQRAERTEPQETPKKLDSDPRINELGRAIEDDFATIRENYGNLAYSSKQEHRTS